MVGDKYNDKGASLNNLDESKYGRNTGKVLKRNQSLGIGLKISTQTQLDSSPEEKVYPSTARNKFILRRESGDKIPKDADDNATIPTLNLKKLGEGDLRERLGPKSARVVLKKEREDDDGEEGRPDIEIAKKGFKIRTGSKDLANLKSELVKGGKNVE